MKPSRSSPNSPRRAQRSEAMTHLSHASFRWRSPARSSRCRRLRPPTRTFTIVNVDGPNEGFNDPTPAAPSAATRSSRRAAAAHCLPVRGRPVGRGARQQRRDHHSGELRSAGAPTCSAPLAPGSASGIQRPRRPRLSLAAPRTRTITARWPTSRGDRPGCRLGLGSAFPEVIAQFSSDFDFYLGLDNNHGAQIDLVVVLLHEFGHGLGFSAS